MKHLILFAVLSLSAALYAQQLIVHEWGTFTSVQGSDGVLLEWRPLLKSDLPPFVYDRTKRGVELQQAGYREKFGLAARQRMETPVIYFYTDEEMTVDVTVKFPQGLITEWYPQVRDFAPMLSNPGKPQIKNGMLRWGKVKLFPAAKNPDMAKLLPKNDAPSHYYPARETDAAYVRSCRTGVNNVTTYEHEKFLFYRGLGDFNAPLKVSSAAGDPLYHTIENTGSEDIVGAFLLIVRDGKAYFRPLEQLKAGSSRKEMTTGSFDYMELPAVVERIKAAMTVDLVKQGLYQAEAAAMVKTWQDSWFEEEGTRVLYLLPTAWTDRVLPLSVTPKPDSTVRVMVGRAEIITPELEAAVNKHVAALADSEFEVRERASREIKKLGRFAEPVLKRVQATAVDPEVRVRAGDLIKALTQVPAR
ncbi:MAG TPA: hypothetical protein VEK08_19570 [Planctomycetota bacterium]|nr:hypothetical protein [Planctomycetota bacterium]